MRMVCWFIGPSDQTAAPETPHGKIVHANGLDIYYEEHGTGDPLLLLHGGTLTCRQWDNHIPTFAKRFHVFALDGRGHRAAPATTDLRRAA